ncbi:hypothetical protein HPG69_002238 [Diceros bicornis minor]|uniref:Uncharacterized protein n=1 Tax=Diceros bicornis minor TaxID=77932 RepID=A0A7J7FCV7_DICBM|nr:hypothetical protein HPG69_002238 [Diceros bicornis minor]
MALGLDLLQLHARHTPTLLSVQLSQCHPGGPQHPGTGEDPAGHPSGEKDQADCSCEGPQPAHRQGPGEAWTGVQCGRLGESHPKGPFSNHSAGGGDDRAGGPGVRIPLGQLLQQYHSAVRGGTKGKEVFL